MNSQNAGNLGSNSCQEKEKKSNFRHSIEKVEKLKKVFRQMPNPENHVIEQLSQELGLGTKQVKNWFYHKRYDIQAHYADDPTDCISILGAA
ncbi:hypothetical protein RND71_025073 [Anisodus tanguticus]|uniref:Homeobox domain-containing protein n=1 Tax=Anisodus tanguticus TaxID=243964 RepID=A0AAE1RSD2_9SOLA|nr:hypothetical protein RND71_025073 [Anisodus tanguticus]